MKAATAALCVVAVITAGAGIAVAHQGAKGVVKERMDLMGDIKDAMKDLGQMVQGKVPYDADRMQARARDLAGHGGVAMTDLFPADSIMGPSEALPAIWRDWDRFQSIAMDLTTSANALAETVAANPGPEAAPARAAAFAAVGQTCKACHADFRIKKN